MQVHESCGHPTELDRAFGTEASYAGTSFLTPDMLGDFRYGSDLCDIVADATVPGGLGTFGWDDEGVAAQQVPLIKEGIFVGYLSSPRDRAADRPPVGRRHARRRLEPDPAHPDDQRQPAAEARHELRRHRRRHRRRPPVRDQPQLVDRRPPAQLPVLDRDLPRDQGRQARQAVPQRHLHRHHLRAVAVDGRRRRRRARGRCGARRTAARASPARPATWATACRARGSATCGSGWSHERPPRRRSDRGIGGDPEAALRLAEEVVRRPRRPARARPRRWSSRASRR